MMKNLMLASAIVLFSLNTSQAVTHTLSGPIDVFQATTNPSNIGAGTGTISGDYDSTTNWLNYSIEWMDLTSNISNMHFHGAAVGSTGGVELGVPGPWASPQIGSGTLTDANELNLLAGEWYLNIHTVDFPGGEVRGQVNVTSVPEPTGSGLAAFTFMSTLLFIRRRSR